MKVYTEIEQAFSDGHDSRDEEVLDLENEIKSLKLKLSVYLDAIKLEKQNYILCLALENIIILSICKDLDLEKINLIARGALNEH